MSLLAIAVSAILGFQPTNVAPPSPKGASNLGSGTLLLDKMASQGKWVADASLSGGRRVTLRWMYWRVYTRPTGRSSIEAVLTCNNPCKGANHVHSEECTAGGCYTKCGTAHKATITTTRGQEIGVEITHAVEKAVETGISVGGEIGIDAGVVSGSLNGGGSQSTTDTNSLSQTIRSAFNSSVSGAVEISVDHFNPDCCSKSTWVYGTYEYEVRVIFQNLEQDYFADDWIIGGGYGGVLPASKLKATGNARFFGGVRDVLLSTYNVPSDEPIDKKHEVNCKCKPKTPTGGSSHSGGDTGSGTGDQSALPKGTSRLVVTPNDSDKVVITNPYRTNIICSTGATITTILPGKSYEVPKSDHSQAVVLGTAAGIGLLGMIIDRNHEVSKVESFQPMPMKDINCALPITELKSGETPLSSPAISNPTMDHDPFVNLANPITSVSIGNVPLGSLPTFGDTPIGTMITGNWPIGSKPAVSAGGNVTDCQSLVEVQNGNMVKSAYVRMPSIGNADNCDLVIKAADGSTSEPYTMKRQRLDFGVSVSPESGPAGSKAVLTIDCRAILAYLELDGASSDNTVLLDLDFSKSGGAKGPKTITVPADGMAKVSVSRGSAPGSFQVGIGMRFKDIPKKLW